MGGVVAGSSILYFHERSKSVRNVSLTVNNQCNLSCPHCYLKSADKGFIIPDHFLEVLLDQDFDHLSIVGREPLVDQMTANKTALIAEQAKLAGKSVSLITNGFGLDFLSLEQIKVFDYIDISFDGGPKTYALHRTGSFERLVKAIRKKRKAISNITILNTIYLENMPDIEDMLKVLDYVDANLMLFSPFIKTNALWDIEATEAEHETYFAFLASKGRFVDCRQALLLLDMYHLCETNTPKAAIDSLAKKHDIENKMYFVPHTPLSIGNVRVTYAGKIMSPRDALHTATYKQALSFDLLETPLNMAYQHFIDAESLLINETLSAAAA